jgi:methylglutaconyl-CoA hydratase
VATLTLDRPDKHNAMSGEMIRELSEAADWLCAEPGLHAVVLAANGKSFCAGGDLGWMRAQMEADASQREREARALTTMLKKLNELPVPLIAKVHGNAFGGGVGLISVADVAVVADHIKMGLTETKLGLIPATIGPYVLARMGEAAARRVFFSSRLFGALEAAELGLAGRVVYEENLDTAVEAEITPYLSCKPGAVADAKALALALGNAPTDADIDLSVRALIRRWESPEAQDGIAAFFAARK